MYQFTNTVIINSALDSNGTLAKFSGASSVFTVTRVNKFLASKTTAYKRAYTAGVKEVAQITIPAGTSGKVARLNIDIRLSDNTYSEYANAYLFFRKPLLVEVIGSGTAATDAAALIIQVNSLKDRFGSNYVVASTGGGAVITLTAANNNQRFFSVTNEIETANTNSLTQVDYVTNATGAVTVHGKLGFGDDEWMISHIQIPTLENTRYFGINKEERPIIGGNYTEYVLRYVIDKEGNDGIVAGGTSITTHVFYVLSTLVTAFDAALSAASISPTTVSTPSS
jgi:hypothetical protein